MPASHHLTEWTQRHQYDIHNIGLLLLMFTRRSCTYQPDPPDNDLYTSSTSMWYTSPEGSLYFPECWIKWFFSPREKSHVWSDLSVLSDTPWWMISLLFFPSNKNKHLATKEEESSLSVYKQSWLLDIELMHISQHETRSWQHCFRSMNIWQQTVHDLTDDLRAIAKVDVKQLLRRKKNALPNLSISFIHFWF